MLRYARSALVTLLVLLPTLGWAQGKVVFEGALGTAFSAPTPLVVNQEGFDQIRLTADYSTRPLDPSPYYQVQVGIWYRKDAKAVVFGFLHHKLYLDNPPPEIQRFEITFGYNTLYVGHAWRKKKWVISAGGGPLIANPYSEVRGQIQDGRKGFLKLGWNVAGATLYGALQRRFPVGGHVFFGMEAKVTGSMAWVTIANGNARVPNVALHFLASFGFGL
ncbi:MAG: hypothetical protein O7E49_08350 [Gemmatimonadetes bacterium]|nr:hypothetical protein [Gemmatimonadota bacterium]